MKLALYGLLLGAAFAAPAQACSIIINDHSYAARLAGAEDALERSTAVIDGEVVRAETPETPALVYAHRVLKGPDQKWFEVGGANDSCTIYLDHEGERMRMVLEQGPDVYQLSLWDNLDDYSRLIDRLLKSNRRRDYPYFPGPRVQEPAEQD